MLCAPEMWKRHTIALLMLPVSRFGEKNEYYHLKETNVMSAWEKHTGFQPPLCVSWIRPPAPGELSCPWDKLWSQPRDLHPTPHWPASASTTGPLLVPANVTLTKVLLMGRTRPSAVIDASPFTQEGIKNRACFFTTVLLLVYVIFLWGNRIGQIVSSADSLISGLCNTTCVCENVYPLAFCAP